MNELIRTLGPGTDGEPAAIARPARNIDSPFPIMVVVALTNDSICLLSICPWQKL
jgi:hypothetical protein